MGDFLDIADKNFLVAGIANKKSVAAAIATELQNAGANLVLTTRSAARAETAAKLFPAAHVCVCDVENDADIAALPERVREKFPVLHGFAIPSPSPTIPKGSSPSTPLCGRISYKR